MMFCKNCGARLEDSVTFCTQCGIRLVKKPSEAAAPTERKPEASFSEENIPAEGFARAEASAPVRNDGAEESAVSAGSPAPTGSLPVMGKIPTSGSTAPADEAFLPPPAPTYAPPPEPAALKGKEKTFFGIGALVFCLILIGALSIAVGVFAGLYFSAIA